SGLFAGASMQSAIIQRPDRIEEAASTAFATNVVGGLLLAGAAAALGPLIGLFFHSGEAGKAASVLAGTIPITALSIVPGGLLQRRISLASALVQPSASLVYGIAAIVTLATGMGLWGLVLATYAGECARTASLWLAAVAHARLVADVALALGIRPPGRLQLAAAGDRLRRQHGRRRPRPGSRRAGTLPLGAEVRA